MASWSLDTPDLWLRTLEGSLEQLSLLSLSLLPGTGLRLFTFLRKVIYPINIQRNNYFTVTLSQPHPSQGGRLLYFIHILPHSILFILFINHTAISVGGMVQKFTYPAGSGLTCTGKKSKLAMSAKNRQPGEFNRTTLNKG